jgi:hypothetical protein
MKVKFFAVLLFVTVVVFAALSQKKNEPFAQAKDFPRDALIYAQITDLPIFIKLWNESKLKAKYEGSQNFDEFQNHHLAMKLASRWEEFNASVGFPIDLETVAGLAENRAAVAVYDIGKLEFVFVAPMNDDIFNATKFVQNQASFEEQMLDDGTAFYSCDVEADRGRQKQKLLFANVQGRFVLATSQKLLMRTLNNINGKSKKDRLIDEPLFSNLSGKLAPNLVTVWVNQTALNNDYYFKHYWLMGDVKDLKNIRAGMFDFDIQEKKLVERREFLLNDANVNTRFSAEKANQMLALLPENIPYYRLQVANPKNLANSISATLFERKIDTENESGNYSHRYNDYYFDDSDWHNYSSLDENYDENVDDVADENVTKINTKDDFSPQILQSLKPANPHLILQTSRPQLLPEPLFAEFNRVTVFKLGTPENLNEVTLENLIAEEMKSRLMISAPNIRLNWVTKNENGQIWRELNPPSLGWGIAYTLRGNELFFSNNSTFLQEILTTKNKELKSENALNELTVIRFDQRRRAFDEIMQRLEKSNKNNFFTGNIASLLDTISEVQRIEIKRNYHENYLREEISFMLLGE